MVKKGTNVSNTDNYDSVNAENLLNVKIQLSLTETEITSFLPYARESTDGGQRNKIERI
jgi:hypothetical protein